MSNKTLIFLVALITLATPAYAGSGPPDLFDWSMIGVFGAAFLLVCLAGGRWLRRWNAR